VSEDDLVGKTASLATPAVLADLLVWSERVLSE
jgi:hypothetical protein